MAVLQPEIQSLFEEVLSFLAQLDGSLTTPLSGKSQELRRKIEQVCFEDGNPEDGEELYDEAGVEAEDVVPSLPTPRRGQATESVAGASLSPPASKGSMKRKSSGSWSYRSDEPEILEVSATSFKDTSKQGFLEKRRPDGLMTKLNPYQKRYCVVHDGIFYYFENATSKKQSGAFHLKEYEARPAFHLIKSVTKKEGSFEMVAPGHRSYQFLAKDFEEMKEWISVVVEWSEHKHPPLSSIIKPADSVDKNSMVSSGSDSGSISAVSGAPDVTVDDQTDFPRFMPMEVSPLAVRNRKPPPPPPTVDEEETYDEAGEEMSGQGGGVSCFDDGQETYDEADVEPRPQSNTIEEEIYDELSGPEEETYDEAGPEAPSTVRSPILKRTMPLPPVPDMRQHRPLPPPPPPPDQKTLTVRSDEYENKFYGLWNCEASLAHELSFSSGDIIHIVDRENDKSGWWMGVLDGKIGLVPKAFLTPAYAAC